MGRSGQTLLLLWPIAVVAMTMGNVAVAEDTLVKTELKVIPRSDNETLVTKLVMNNNLITLNEVDQTALATYPTLAELYLDGNQVAAVPAKYFSVVPNLRALSLTRNNLSRLDPEAFSGLNDLTHLDLSHNLLTGFPSQLFRGLKHLKVLRLQNNPWNCSCPLLTSIQEVKQAKVDIGGVTCASPEEQAGKELLNATAVCYSHPPPTAVSPQQPTTLNSTLAPSENRSTDHSPALGNVWKFTICVGALALTTLILIALAFKGPSWYKLYHNYRHRRLDRETEEGRVVGSTGSSTRYLNQQTFTFKQGNGQVVGEEDWDEYFEDPYIKREELQAGEENLSDPRPNLGGC